MEWRSESWMFNDPCEVCGVRRLDHDPIQIRHFYLSPALPLDAFYDCEFWDNVKDTTAGTVERAIRRLIRERAGPTQEDLADELFVSRWTVAGWEKPAGYRNGNRRPGREPVGELRKKYSELLGELSSPELATRQRLPHGIRAANSSCVMG